MNRIYSSFVAFRVGDADRPGCCASQLASRAAQLTVDISGLTSASSSVFRRVCNAAKSDC